LQLTAEQKFRAEERELQKNLEEAEKKLAELQKKKAEGVSEATVDKAVEATAEKFTQEILATRKELRRVQLALREDIESLETWLLFINIGLIPILVGVVAMGLGAARHRRRRRGLQAPEG
jgi:multidrug resistance efflux pump